jgi:SAM-dependent methyltransferase
MTDDLIYERPPLIIRNDIPIFLEPDVYSENYDKIARDHIDVLLRGVSNPFIEERVWQVMESSTLALLHKYVAPGDRLLDIGVGLGRLLRQVPECRRFGVDISFDYLNEAVQWGIEVCCAPAEDLPYREEFFDVIVCTDVLEHVFDLNKAITNILRVLKKNGILIIRVPDSEDLAPYLAPEYPYRFAHVRSFDEPGLRLLFSRVFGCQFIEGAGAYVQSHVKMKVPLPRKIRGALTMALSIVTRWSSDLYNWSARRFFDPLEINVVFRKS